MDKVPNQQKPYINLSGLSEGLQMSRLVDHVILLSEKNISKEIVKKY